ncbi:phenylalanine--tRNA ligase subunit beta [Glycomyces harbinensis]|uniref:Phenylalanine--tRNA ligase beta subunit n=1 Tax=Glycomyces harbinensis TaxID=58114 RepID=A0A1G6SGE2_9ACTN|nr:phenylalanine--tRNA ligase subunit beta [Glycomyces harbinensis]SDD15175.1 phenylalanyl-tRNA synthetase beta subunit [Glycomyces harbinensis]
MRIPVSWLAEYAALPADLSTEALDAALVEAGLEVEEVDDLRGRVTGPLVVGRVASIEELTEFKKPIRHCWVEVGEAEPRSVICGARNFAEGDLVVVALPGAELPGGFKIGSRKTYGRLSDGMICSASELGVSDDHDGIIVLPEGDVGADARPLVGLDEVVFELAITPDMGYCFSVRGIAREVAHRLGVAFTDPVAKAAEPKATAGQPFPLSVETDGCTRFTLRAVRDVDANAEAPEWMAKRLTQAGMRPLGLAVDVTNYLMLELGHPLHAFDLDALEGGLTVRRANPGETLTTLDDVERVLDPEDMVICDATGPLSLAGVMGGQTSEVGPTTSNVLIEAAHWNPVSIARTSRRHKLTSEASKRYERGADAAISMLAAQRAADLLVEYGGGTLVAEVADVDRREPIAPIVMPVDLPSKTIGVEYDRELIVAMLEAAGCEVVGGKVKEGTVEGGDVFTVVPASWRPDLTDPADLVEEVARLHGYGHIPSSIPRAIAGTGLSSSQRRRRRVARALADNGFVETYTFPFVSRERADELGLDEKDPQREAIAVLNPLDDAAPLLRTTVLASLVNAVKVNLARGARDLAVFEEGLVFQPAEGWTELDLVALPVSKRPADEAIEAAIRRLPVQPRHVAAVLCGQAVPVGVGVPGRAVDWTDAVEAAEVVAEASGVQLQVAQGEAAPWHPGRCAELRVDGLPVGHAGELHPEVCDRLGLPKRTVAMELDLSALPAAGLAPAPVISHFPATLIDVAVVVAEAVPAGEVESALREGAGELLDGLRLFDVYRDAKLGEDRKSLAFKLELRAADRTLTNEEGVAVRDAAVAVAAERFGASIRV